MRYLGPALASLMLVASAAAQAQNVQVGLIAPLTGPAASYGKDILNGASLAVDEINAAGGIGGRKLVLLQGDDRGSPKDAANVAQNFVSDANVLAMIGGATSTATFGAVPVAQRGKLPFVITLASHPDLTKEGDYIFRNSVTQEDEGPAIARLVSSCLGAKTVGIIHLNNDWALAMTKEFKNSLDKLNIKIVAEDSYDVGDNIDYSSKLMKVKAANPDVIFFGSQYNDLALVLKQAQRVDLGKTPLVASAGDHSTGLIDVAGAAANGLYLHTLFFQDSVDPKVRAFVTKFQDKFKQAPNLF
jgi:branched-chain amino acid transport system substrate-binding protein